MRCTVTGIIVEQGKVKSKDGKNEYPYTVIYSYGESIKIFDFDTTTADLYTKISFDAKVRVGKYGLEVSPIPVNQEEKPIK